MIHTLATLLFWGGLITGAIMLLQRAYRQGRTDVIREQREIDRYVEQARDQRDHDVAGLSDGDYRERLARWLQHHGVDPRR